MWWSKEIVVRSRTEPLDVGAENAQHAPLCRKAIEHPALQFTLLAVEHDDLRVSAVCVEKLGRYQMACPAVVRAHLDDRRPRTGQPHRRVHGKGSRIVIGMPTFIRMS